MYPSDQAAPVVIPVRARIEKYLRVHLAGQPLRVAPGSSFLGLFVWGIAQSEKVGLFTGFHGRTVSVRTYFGRELNRSFPVLLPADRHYSRRYHLLNQPEAMSVNNVADWLLMNQFLTEVRASDESAFRLARQFCERYDFSDDELTERSLCKRAERDRRSRRDAAMATGRETPARGTSPFFAAHYNGTWYSDPDRQQAA